MSRSRFVLSLLAVGALGWLAGRTIAREQTGTAAEQSAVPASPTDGATRASAPLTRPRLLGLGRIESGRGLLTLASEVPGVVASVPVQLGDTVPTGGVLVRFRADVEDEGAREKAAAARAARPAAAAATAAVAQARATFTQAERTLARVQRLRAAGAESQESLEQAQVAVDVAREALAAAEATAEARAADVRAAEAATAVAQARVAQRVLRAPEPVEVLRIERLPGEAVDVGVALLELAPLGPRVARCEIDELAALDAAVGQRGVVRAVGQPDVLGRGVVVRVAPGLSPKSLVAGVTAEAEDRRVREVRLQLEPSVRLPFNARVECELERTAS